MSDLVRENRRLTRELSDRDADIREQEARREHRESEELTYWLLERCGASSHLVTAMRKTYA